MSKIYLKKEDILKANDSYYEDVDVPEWGGSVRIKVMSGSERDAYEASIYELKGTEVKFNREDFRSKLLAKVIVDEKGDRPFG